MTSFAVETSSRWDAIDLQRELSGYAPWLVELSRGRWNVRGSVDPDGVAALEELLAVWAAGRTTAVPALLLLDISPYRPDELA